jgi:hypothetical protein
MQAAPDLESRLSLLFATMEALKASIRREREEAKLSRRRYWWQEQQTECPPPPKL